MNHADEARALEFAFEFHIAMGTLLGTRWTSKHGETPSAEWQRLLARFAHMDPQALAAKIVSQLKPNTRGEVWPPEMADVIAMAAPKPEDFDLPTVEQAYRDAAHLRWSRHPVVYETARRVGVSEIRSEARSRPAFEREYAEVCAEWMAGTRFQEPKTRQEDMIGHEPVKPAWMQKYPSVPVGDFAALRRAIGPLPESEQPVTPPVPVNDVDTDALAEIQHQASRYRRTA